MKRRSFLQIGAASLPALLGRSSGATESGGTWSTGTPLPQRRFGHTGLQVPILGLGTASAGYALPDKEAQAIFHKAIDVGITYLDAAVTYGRAQLQLAPVLRERRKEVILVAKCRATQKEDMLNQITRSLGEMGTDYVDFAFMHSLGEYDVNEVLATNGSMAGLVDAKKRGLTRFIGFSCHNYPSKALKVLKEAEVDACMMCMNLADRHTYGFEKEVLPFATQLGVGVAAMKIFGGPKGMQYDTIMPSALHSSGYSDHQTALRYTLSLPGLSLVIVGMHTMPQVVQNAKWAKEFRPLESSEMKAVEEAGQKLAAQWGHHLGPSE